MFVTLEGLELGPHVEENARIVLKIITEECGEQRTNLTIDVGVNDTLREALRYLQDHGEIAVIGWEDMPIKYQSQSVNVAIPQTTQDAPDEARGAESPPHYVYAFVDFPNINEQPNGLLTAQFDWELLASLIKEAAGVHDAIEMHLYFHNNDLIPKKIGWAQEVLGPSRNAGFLTHVAPKWSKDTDAHMIVDMMDMDLTHIPRGGRVTYVLVSGDRDFAPALLRKKKRAQDRGLSFDITIMSLSERISNVFPHSTQANFVPLDDADLFKRGVRNESSPTDT